MPLQLSARVPAKIPMLLSLITCDAVRIGKLDHDSSVVLSDLARVRNNPNRDFISSLLICAIVGGQRSTARRNLLGFSPNRNVISITRLTFGKVLSCRDETKKGKKIMASAFEVASSVARWALSNNLVPPLPAGMEGEYLANVPPVQVSPEGEDVLRSRAISSLVFNDPESTVYVYTEKRVTQKELERLPQLIGGCHILYPHGTLDDLGGEIESAQGSGFAMVNTANQWQAYCCGSSVSPGNEASAGTMGALVRRPDGTIFGLTNNHVTGGCNHSAIGLPILAPGVLDVAAGSVQPFTIGFHECVLPYALGTTGNVNVADNTDAALFKIQDANWVSSMQGLAYDTPQVVSNPIEGLIVEKVGRTTGHTRGKIVGRELRPIRVKATSARNSFQAIIMFPGVFIVHGDHRPFSEGGDSGSLVVATHPDGTRSAVGVVFAGGQDSLAPGSKRTSILPIGPILNRLGVTLVGGHNVTTPNP